MILLFIFFFPSEWFQSCCCFVLMTSSPLKRRNKAWHLTWREREETSSSQTKPHLHNKGTFQRNWKAQSKCSDFWANLPHLEGLHKTEVAYLLLTQQLRVWFLAFPRMSLLMWLRFVNGTALKSGQRLENVNRTHLVPVCGNQTQLKLLSYALIVSKLFKEKRIKCGSVIPKARKWAIQ